jgi:hypothetical protein
MIDFETARPQGRILDMSVRGLFDKLPTPAEMLKDGQEYYATFGKAKP